ncbi:polyketide cyclase / dehydrase and lipid transport family protein [Ralstonia insidiosa]|uniref:Polyketide cyclase / dehydrase and lipid transport family protein n=1 Tax=Ralstonia insidiosa TaxID=190721 RepID=A0AAC9BLF7_9RALS|nr:MULTISPECIES: SRPBCC family protein [Ralstonia]ANH76546.1 polyketide cyclase / dehydrase and lipid transport family protein [Ralstonia insidiosa]EPX99049.1 polyketide cyclase [Ralstonia sp. AU12-08]MBY4705885.1 SRPBCC family protein [Ralstonia insidiosa]
MLKVIAIVIVVAIVAVLGFAATRPDSFRVQREIDIKAPPEKVFALIDDFHHWTAWSPWEKLDPAMKRTYGGPTNGKGANYAWEGSSKVGAGRMEIVDTSLSNAPARIQIQLDFLKPFEAHNTAEFTLKPAGDLTHVTWAMYGPSPFISKVMGLFFSMDAVIGKDFEAGLANLKSAAES